MLSAFACLDLLRTYNMNGRDGRVPSSEQTARNQQIQARELEKLSTALIDVGINAVKRNPVPSGLYVIGILLCLFFR